MAPLLQLCENDEGKALSLPDGLKDQCLRAHPYWREETVDKALIGYRQFMKLKLQQEDWDATILSPSCVVDQVWHQHILHVKQYTKACKDYCDGHVIDHNPDGGLDQDARKQRIQATKLCLKTLFGKQVDAEIWSFGNDNKKKKGSNNQQTPRNVRPYAVASSTRQSNTITVKVRQISGAERLFNVRKSLVVGRLVDTYVRQENIDPANVYFTIHGGRFDSTATLALLGLEDQDEIDVWFRERGY